jgi:tetratricopeptide (TPR) repeat protein
MKKGGWLVVPAAFFFLINFSISSVKVLFLSRAIYFFLLVSLFFFLRKFDIDKLLRSVVGGVALIVFIYGIVQKFVLFPLYLRTLTPEDNTYSKALIARIESGRIFSIFRLPTLYAIICVVFILFTFHYLLKARDLKIRVYWFILTVLGLVNLVLTQSFGGLIYLSVGILTYLLLSRILTLKHLAPVLMIFTLLFSLLIALRFPEARKMEPVMLRISNWQQAVRAIQSSPVWGVGLGNYESRVSYFTRSNEAKSIYAHNFFLQFIAETGVIIPFFLLILLVISRRRLALSHSSNRNFGGVRNPGGTAVPTSLPVAEGKKDHFTENHLYISVFFALLTYNLIDIGFYFFAAGVVGGVVLSQVYRVSTVSVREKDRRFKLSLAMLILPALIMGVESVSESFRTEGEILLNQNHPGEAALQFKKSFNINPFNYKAITGYGLIQLAEKNREEGERYLDRALESYPDSSAAHFLKSKTELARGHLLNAFYHAAVAHGKNRIDARYRNWYRGLKANLENHLKKAAEEEAPAAGEVTQ